MVRISTVIGLPLVDLIDPDRRDVMLGVEHLDLIERGFPSDITMWHYLETNNKDNEGKLEALLDCVRRVGYDQESRVPVVKASDIEAEHYRIGPLRLVGPRREVILQGCKIEKEYVSRGGLHRMAVMQFLGEEYIPVDVVDEPDFVPPNYREIIERDTTKFIKTLFKRADLYPRGVYQPLPFPEFEDCLYTRSDTEQKLKAVLTKIDPRGTRLLDLGSGLGYFPFMFLQLGADSCVGVEADPANYYISNTVAESKGLCAEFRWDIITPELISDMVSVDAFDVTLLLGIVHHLIADNPAFHRWTLRRHGVGFVQDIFAAIHSVSDRFVFDMPVRPTGDDRWDHNRSYPDMGSSPTNQVEWIIKNLCTATGWKVAHLHEIGRRPLFICEEA